MRRGTKVVALALAMLVAMSSLAIAAVPVAGKFKGWSDAVHPHKVIIEVDEGGTNISLLKVVVPDPEGNCTVNWTDVKIKDDGSFRAVKKSGTFITYQVTGNFTGKRKAEGDIFSVVCWGESGSYVARNPL